MMARVKVDSLVFSGRDEDFEFFSERFEARLASLKLVRYLTMMEVRTGITQDQLNEHHADIWYELVLCLDKRKV